MPKNYNSNIREPVIRNHLMNYIKKSILTSSVY